MTVLDFILLVAVPTAAGVAAFLVMRWGSNEQD